MPSQKNIVVIGGGTGTFVALTGLKHYPVNLSAIITMMDSGGSTGRLRDQLGVLPPGDLRQALVALSRSDKLWRDLFLYRFEKGDLKGHNFGNLFVSALEKVSGSIEKAIEHAGHILDTEGEVIPVTFTHCHLCVSLSDGTVIKGETYIDELEKNKSRSRITRAYLEPKATANPQALRAIKEADMIVIGPGDLYTSIIPNLIVGGIAEALKAASAKKVFVMNLMTKHGQTTGYSAADHLSDLRMYIDGAVDVVLLNKAKPDKNTLKLYESEKEQAVESNLKDNGVHIVVADLLNTAQIKKTDSDILKRSLIRHDPHKLAKHLMALL